MLIEPEISTCSIVLVGRFNPAIFHPSWFALSVITVATYAFADYSKKLPLNRLRQWLRWILGRIGSGHVYTNLYFLAQKR